MAWAVKVSGEEHREQKARQCKGPGVRPCVVSLEASKTLCSEPGAGVEGGAGKAAQDMEGRTPSPRQSTSRVLSSQQALSPGREGLRGIRHGGWQSHTQNSPFLPSFLPQNFLGASGLQVASLLVLGRSTSRLLFPRAHFRPQPWGFLS